MRHSFFSFLNFLASQSSNMVSTVSGPLHKVSDFLPEALVSKIRSHTAAAENAGQLLPGQLALVRENKWFHLFVPPKYGGLGLSLPEAVRLEEALAWADGSLAWVVTLCAGAGMFVGYLDEELANEIFSDPNACLAGSGQVGGTATVTGNGYFVTGAWPYSSGAPHATWFTANCMVEKDGLPCLQADGGPQVLSFLFKKEEVALEANWQYIGLNATAGHAYSVDNVWVPSHRAFTIDATHARLTDPVYQYPFLQLAETTLAANIAGMAASFFAHATVLLGQKQYSNPRSERVGKKGLELLHLAETEMEKLRTDFYKSLDASWQCLLLKNEKDECLLKEISAHSRKLSAASLKWVDNIYPYCGLEAARWDTAINQVWRNLHTASQHSLLLDA